MLPQINLPRINTGPFQFGNKIVAPTTWQTGAEDPEQWLYSTFPTYFSCELGAYHRELWRWAQSMKSGTRPDSFIAIWPRGSGKSTNLEVLPIWLHTTNKRHYCWYISSTQPQADDHVMNVGSMLETVGADRKLNKYGSSRGWRRNRLWTDSGLIVDALGLDTARRGVKAEERRPDIMIFDDIDTESDTIETTMKKEVILQRKLLPAGARHVAVVFGQNLVIPHGVVSRLHTGASSWLHNRIVSGPFPAVTGLVTENRDGRDVIVEGEPTWEGLSLEDCQEFIDDWGLESFKQEAQHDVFGGDSQIFNPDWWEDVNRFHPQERFIPTVARYLFVDTAFKDKAHHDASAVSVVDLLDDYRIMLRHMWCDRVQSASLPDIIISIAEQWGGEEHINAVVIEDKGSGTTTIQTLRNASPPWLADIIVEFMPTGSKEYRARNASVWCSRHCVLLPVQIPDNVAWMTPFADATLGQLFRFPNAPHDDMVDTFVMSILYLEHYIMQGWQLRMGHDKDDKDVWPDSRIERVLKDKR